MITWPKCLVFWMLLGISLQLHAQATLPSCSRGAILFMNYCSGCHSLRYLSWPRMMNDLQLTQTHSLQVKQHNPLYLPNLAPIWPQIAMSPWEGKQWFGRPPPDLSLISHQRGAAWINAYLLGFYPDPNQRFGVNNHRFPHSMMPHVLESLQTDLPAADFEAVVADIVSFLEYAAEPSILERTRMGWFVIGFLVIMCALYWLRARSRVTLN